MRKILYDFAVRGGYRDRSATPINEPPSCSVLRTTATPERASGRSRPGAEETYTMAPAKVISIKEPTDGGNEAIGKSEPYAVIVTIQGAADYLFHRWNPEAVEAKANAAKNSAAKKTDDVENYVWRMDDGNLAIPGEHLRGAIVAAAKFRQDPRSPRKSAMDLFKAGVVVTTILAPLGTKKWDYLDKRRAMVQRNGINRVRPAMRIGWQASFEVMVLLPEYIDRNALRETIESAGRLCGIGDFRPTFGRFGIVKFK